MSAINLSTFSDPKFKSDKFVIELSQKCVGGQELIDQKKQIQLISKDVNSTLKKNVYENYKQFIEAAKEISNLESEMHQISHLLSEQQTLLTTLSSTAILIDQDAAIVTEIDSKKENSAEKEEEIRRQKIADILEKVEGCSDVVGVEGCIPLHEGELIELDPVENTAIHRLRAYLFNHGLMLATWVSNRRGPMRYKFQIMYDLGSLAVVNVKDLGPVKHAFKLLVFPDTRLFQCATGAAKKEWMDIFYVAKKERLSKDNVKKEPSLERTSSIESQTQSQDDDVETHPDWLLDVPEDLEVLIVERHFEDAYALLVRTADYLEECRDKAGTVEIRRKVEAGHRHLTEVLMKELEVTEGKSLHGGIRSSRRNVRLLNLLGRSGQACELFLRRCSVAMKMRCRDVKKEGSTAVYVRRLASTVFTSLCQATEEFLRAFPESPGCTSTFVVWAGNEVSTFTRHFIKNVFLPQTSLATITECVLIARSQCERLWQYGIDRCYHLEGDLRNPLTRALREAAEKLIEAIKLRATEEKWIPYNLKTKQVLNRTLQEYAEIGVSLDGFVTGGCWLQLSATTVTFVKLYLGLVESCLRLQTPELLHVVNAVLYEVFDYQLRVVEQAYKDEQQIDNQPFISADHKFLTTTILATAENKYFTTVGVECPTLAKIRSRPLVSSKQTYSSDFI